MNTPLGRLVVYTRKMEEMAAFYCRHFGFEAVVRDGDRIVELRPRDGGATILLHPASKGQKTGQSLVKLVFDVEDVESFCASARQSGLVFGPVHTAGGYSFANARDPSDNPISVSSRAFSA
ncbi:VOC family protein [Pseudohoeflea suaedae]|uniref:VOC family protein n=1 Tax=Pseudohoeflea suaedae TaxID=877384 RepID=A0A4R5PM53_9HYPH|nr:VOC family protein [Pseudohoeflea suaedae]TDH37928.1 VOC family protein [Pseudohoeflea suaedae]